MAENLNPFQGMSLFEATQYTKNFKDYANSINQLAKTFGAQAEAPSSGPSPWLTAGLQVLSGGFGALGDVLAEDKRFENQMASLERQAQLQRPNLQPWQQAGLTRLATSFGQPAPVYQSQSTLPPAEPNMEGRIASLRARLQRLQGQGG